MRRLMLFISVIFSASSVAQAQALPQDPGASNPRYTLAVGYQNVRANAPPSSCGCFDMNGGFASGTWSLNRWLSARVDITGGHANNIGPLGQNLTLLTYTAGPQVSYRLHRFLPHAEFMVGGAHGSDSYFPETATFSSSAASFALNTGGGLDYRLNQRFTLRPVEVQYLHTAFPNAGNNKQNQFIGEAGIVWNLPKR